MLPGLVALYLEWSTTVVNSFDRSSSERILAHCQARSVRGPSGYVLSEDLRSVMLRLLPRRCRGDSFICDVVPSASALARQYV